MEDLGVDGVMNRIGQLQLLHSDTCGTKFFKKPHVFNPGAFLMTWKVLLPGAYITRSTRFTGRLTKVVQHLHASAFHVIHKVADQGFGPSRLTGFAELHLIQVQAKVLTMLPWQEITYAGASFPSLVDKDPLVLCMTQRAFDLIKAHTSFQGDLFLSDSDGGGEKAAVIAK